MTGVRAVHGPAVRQRRVPSPSFAHLARLTDDTGLFEHARRAIPRRAHGYCTDDVARGLVVVSREPEPTPAVARLAECYLAFLTHAQHRDGAFHNRLGHDRHWTDEPGLGDWWGRALWGLGTAAARNPLPWIRTEAMAAFAAGAERRSPAPHAMAFAGLGAAEVLREHPDDGVAAELLADAAAAIGRVPVDRSWRWPQSRLTYANAAFAEVVIRAGEWSGDADQLDAGLAMLRWLRDLQFTAGHFSVVAAGGWPRSGRRPTHDQQPIELAALADACATAFDVTGDPRWAADVDTAVYWFLGANDCGVPMWDEATGGGYDGLTPAGPNLNQGAESTLALIATLQHRRRG